MKSKILEISRSRPLAKNTSLNFGGLFYLHRPLKLKFMFSSDAILEEFVAPIAMCSQETSLATIVEAIGSSQNGKIAIVDRDSFPLGLVCCKRLTNFLLERKYLTISANAGNIRFNKRAFPVIGDLNHLIEPVVNLTAQMKIGEFLLYLQSESANSVARQDYAAIDSRGKLLGLVNIPQILKYLSCHPQPRPVALYSKIDRALEKILDRIPLPIALQNHAGQTIYHNHYWQNSIESTDRLNPVPKLSKPSSTIPPTQEVISLEWEQHLNHNTSHSRASNIPNLITTNYPSPSDSYWQSQHQQQVDLQWRLWRQSNSKQDDNLAFLDITPHCYCLKANYHLTSFLTPAKQPLIITELSKNIASTANLMVVDRHSFPDRNQTTVDRSLLPENRQETSINPPAVSNQEPRNWYCLRLPLELNRQDLELMGSTIETKLFSARENAKHSSDNTAFTPRACQYWLVLAIQSWMLPSFNPLAITTEAELIKLARLKDELLANIGHELKSPLTGIIGLSSLLQEPKLGNFNQRQLRYIRSISSSGRQLMNIVNDLLDLSHLAIGQFELNLESINLKLLFDRVYQQALDKLRTSPTQTEDVVWQRQLTVNNKFKINSAIADRLRLDRILTHLLKNAIQFSVADSQIGIDVEAISGWIAITVWDRGSGIPASEQVNLLEQLTQFPSLQIDRTCRTGLGLILARHLAKAHGGDISFISEIDFGSQFTLLLPDLEPELHKIDRSHDSAAIKYNSLVLIIDNHPKTISTLSFKLKQQGVYPIIARTGTEALAKARQLKPSKILLNPKLPLISGQTILNLLKSDDLTESIPLFIISDRQEKETISQKYPQAQGLVCLSPEEPLLSSITNHNSFQSSSSSRQQDLLTVKNESLKPENCDLKSNKSITILCLDPRRGYDGAEADPDFPIKDWVHGIGSNERHRVIEADSLEQASMLAKIWHLDVIVLNGRTIEQPLQYLQSLQQYPCLAALPLITLDTETTAVANQISGLSVFPCLVPAQCRNIGDLIQVIQIAIGNRM